MAKKFDSSSHELVDIGDKVHQPKSLVFPKRKCGIKDRCFQRDWFDKWPWLHYNELNDLAYYFTCMKVIKEKKVKTGNVDACFIPVATLIGRMPHAHLKDTKHQTHTKLQSK